MARVALTFEIEVQSALHLGRAPLGVGEYLFTQKFIPGAALRGALAEAFIHKQRLAPDSARFQALFDGPDAVRFEPAYPATKTGWGYPFPLTAQQCKEHGGFPASETTQEQRQHFHGAFDTLVSQVVFGEQVTAWQTANLNLPFLDSSRCPHCWRKTEPAKGGYGWNEWEQQPEALPPIELIRHTHTAINRARGVAEDGMLYTVETLEPGSFLRGRVWADACDLEEIRAALAHITHLGRGARRGSGRVIVDPVDTWEEEHTQARIKALTHLIQAERDVYAHLRTGQAAPPVEGYYFTLDLLSPAVFGEGGVATLDPDPLPLTTPATLVRSFTTPEVVGGWWKAAGLPYGTNLAVAAGSVFLYHVPAGTNLERLSVELDALRAGGIGYLRERGYGAVLPCAPFHLWTAEKEAERQ